MPDMPNLIISEKIQLKLDGKSPPVERREVIQCFQNRSGKLLYDTRPDHLSNPLTLWFLALTNAGRLLKVAYIPRDGNMYLRSSYDPNPTEVLIYKKYG